MRYLLLLLLSSCATIEPEPVRQPSVCLVCHIIRNSILVSETDKRICTQCECCKDAQDLCCCRHVDTCTCNPTRGGQPCQNRRD